MKKRSMIRRLGTFLMALALAGFLWGCGENSITGVDQRDVQMEATEDGDTPIDDDHNGWW